VISFTQLRELYSRIAFNLVNLSWMICSFSYAQNAWYQKALDLDSKSQVTIKNSIVAVIDTGADITHPALKNCLWTNPGESGLDSQGRDKATNGIDDDKNGFIDDVHGWNFANNSGNIQDNHGHGTHIAGLIAGDSKDFKGIAPCTPIMVLKYFDISTPGGEAPGNGNLMNTVRAIKYALLMGATIINYSGGGAEPNPLEKKVLEEALLKNVLVVAAAGNEGTDSDLLGFYPASYNLKNILSVAAVGPNLKRVPSSNWGLKKVKIAAPGENILSALPHDQMGFMTGTSQETALMTGLAVLLKEKRPELKKPEDIIRVLTSSGLYNPNLVGQIHTPSKASAKRALFMASEFSSEEEKSLSNFTP
jgi:thermitase